MFLIKLQEYFEKLYSCCRALTQWNYKTLIGCVNTNQKQPRFYLITNSCFILNCFCSFSLSVSLTTLGNANVRIYQYFHQDILLSLMDITFFHVLNFYFIRKYFSWIFKNYQLSFLYIKRSFFRTQPVIQMLQRCEPFITEMQVI